MYRAFFSVLLLKFVCVCGQHVRSPCPDYFDYNVDRNGVYGLIKLVPSGYFSSLLLKANFTIAARIPTNYAGSIVPLGSDPNLLANFNRGVPLVYRVNFPVVSPVPKLTVMTVNGDVVCVGPGDALGHGEYITTISLQHNLFFKSGPNGFIPVQNTQSFNKPGTEIVLVQEIPSNVNPDDFINYLDTNKEQSTKKPDPERHTNKVTTGRPTAPTRTTTQRPRPTLPPEPVPQPDPETFESSPGTSMECGINPRNDPESPIVPLIVQGETFDRGDWPWLVAIFKRKFSSLSYICAGTLVSDRHVITAAHCMQRKSTYTPIKNIVVRAGVYNIEDFTDDDITVTRGLAAASIHEAYNASTLANDILVLTLVRGVPLGTHIKPACLWSGNTNLKKIVGRSGVVAGWGATEMGPAGKGEPRMVEMPIVSTETCRSSKPDYHKLTSSRTLCAGDHSGSGPCLGDSGGGLYILHNGRWRLRGVVSLSLWAEGDASCNVDDYIVFTDTAQYLPWIETVMSNNVR